MSTYLVRKFILILSISLLGIGVGITGFYYTNISEKKPTIVVTPYQIFNRTHFNQYGIKNLFFNPERNELSVPELFCVRPTEETEGAWRPHWSGSSDEADNRELKLRFKECYLEKSQSANIKLEQHNLPLNRIVAMVSNKAHTEIVYFASKESIGEVNSENNCNYDIDMFTYDVLTKETTQEYFGFGQLFCGNKSGYGYFILEFSPNGRLLMVTHPQGHGSIRYVYDLQKRRSVEMPSWEDGMTECGLQSTPWGEQDQYLVIIDGPELKITNLDTEKYILFSGSSFCLEKKSSILELQTVEQDGNKKVLYSLPQELSTVFPSLR